MNLDFFISKFNIPFKYIEDGVQLGMGINYVFLEILSKGFLHYLLRNNNHFEYEDLVVELSETPTKKDELKNLQM